MNKWLSHEIPPLDLPCKQWPGFIDRDGYGRLGRRIASRMVWEKVNGPIAKGLTIDHMCKTRSCIELTHLQLLTQGENSLRGSSPPALEARQTHCRNGHPFSGENLKIWRGRRACVICNRAKARRNSKAYLERKRAARLAS